MFENKIILIKYIFIYSLTMLNDDINDIIYNYLPKYPDLKIIITEGNKKKEIYYDLFNQIICRKCLSKCRGHDCNLCNCGFFNCPHISNKVLKTWFGVSMLIPLGYEYTKHISIELYCKIDDVYVKLLDTSEFDYDIDQLLYISTNNGKSYEYTDLDKEIIVSSVESDILYKITKSLDVKQLKINSFKFIGIPLYKNFSEGYVKYLELILDDFLHIQNRY